MELTTTRPPIPEFAALMYAQLAANDHKGGWGNANPFFLLAELENHVAALRRHVERWHKEDPGLQIFAIGDIADDAADVANFAMMIWEVTQ